MPSVAPIATMPAITFTAVSVSRMPTLKASSTEEGAAPRSTTVRNACSVPMPPGVAGTSVARLSVTWTSSALRIDWSMPNAPRKNQIVAIRSVQSPSCHGTTVRSQRRGGRMTANAWPMRCPKSSIL